MECGSREQISHTLYIPPKQFCHLLSFLVLQFKWPAVYMLGFQYRSLLLMVVVCSITFNTKYSISTHLFHFLLITNHLRPACLSNPMLWRVCIVCIYLSRNFTQKTDESAKHILSHIHFMIIHTLTTVLPAKHSCLLKTSLFFLRNLSSHHKFIIFLTPALFSPINF